MIDDPTNGGSEPGAWQRALDRDCLEGRTHGPDSAVDDALPDGGERITVAVNFNPDHPEASRC